MNRWARGRRERVVGSLFGRAGHLQIKVVLSPRGQREKRKRIISLNTCERYRGKAIWQPQSPTWKLSCRTQARPQKQRARPPRADKGYPPLHSIAHKIPLFYKQFDQISRDIRYATPKLRASTDSAFRTPSRKNMVSDLRDPWAPSHMSTARDARPTTIALRTKERCPPFSVGPPRPFRAQKHAPDG